MSPIHYNVSVEHEGGADLDFTTETTEELVPHAIVADDRGRSYVVLSAELMPEASDPLRTDLRFGKARARPVE